jgi:hypothetical protein
MALFSKTSPLNTAIGNRDKLRTRLSDNDEAILAATANANALALANADDATLDVAEAQVRSRVDRGKTLAAALVEADAQVQTHQSEEDDLADQNQRNHTVIECHKLKEALNKESAVMAASATRMADILARIVPLAREADGVKNFAIIAQQQLPEAAVLLSRLIDEYAASVLRKDAPSKLKQPEQPIVPTVVAKPVRMTLFAMRSIKHTDPDSGELIVKQKFQDVEMPPTYAKVALDLRVCVRVSDPLRQQHRGTVAGHPDAALAFDLDAAMNQPKPAAADPIMASASASPNSPFTEIDRGPAIQAKFRI